jgi:8-oxo-dGTP pyrophosphatase MutT (NUDIX family)
MEKSCGAVIFSKNGKREYLLLKYGWGHWGFVKGHVEEGEDEKQTVLREAEEEAGINAEQLEFIPSFKEKISYFYTNEGKRVYKEVTYFLVKSSEKNVKLSHEHTDYRWLPYKEAMELLTYQNDKNVLYKAEKFLDN